VEYEVVVFLNTGHERISLAAARWRARATD
jgi:hypothetical protein